MVILVGAAIFVQRLGSLVQDQSGSASQVVLQPSLGKSLLSSQSSAPRIRPSPHTPIQNHHNLRHFSEQGYISQSGIQLLAQESPLLITQTRSAVPNGQQLSATESERVHAACSSAWPQFKAFITQLLPRVENLFPYRAFKIKSLQSQLEDCVIDSKHSSLALHHYLLLLLEVYLCQSEYQASIGELPIQAFEEELRTWLNLMQKKESAGMERLKVLRNDIHLADLSQLMRLTNGVIRLQMHFRRRLARHRQAVTVEDSQCVEEDQPAS
jgi:hypothetical protein